MKKILLSILFVALLTMSSCGDGPDDDLQNDSGSITNIGTSQSVETVPLTQDEVDLLDAIGDDLEVISESDYADVVTEMIYHTDLYTGKVIQVEGVFSSNLNGDSVPYI